MTLTLCDTGPLVALIDRDDEHHDSCAAALQSLPRTPLVTTWPCFTEAMYLLGRVGGLPAQDELWGFLIDGLIRLYVPESPEYDRMRSLMRQYGDTPMDLADCSIVIAAERLNVSRIFTLDSHFRLYRIGGTRTFEVVPQITA